MAKPAQEARLPARLALTRRNWWVNLNLGIFFLYAAQVLTRQSSAQLGWIAWGALGFVGLLWRLRVRTVVVVDPEAARVTCTRYGIRRVSESGVELDRVARTSLEAAGEMLDTLVLHLHGGGTWALGADTCFGRHTLREIELRIAELIGERAREPEPHPDPPLAPRPAPALQLALPKPEARVA